MGDYATMAYGSAEVRYLKGVMIASLSAGPIVVLPLAVAAVGAGPADLGDVIGGMIGLLLLSLPIGFVVSLLPNLLGASLLAWVGRRNIAARLPILWLLAGAGLGGALGVLLDGTATPAGDSAPMVALIGAASAGVCRWFTTWQD